MAVLTTIFICLMAVSFVNAGCSVNFTPIANKCYRFHQTLISWQNAQKTCGGEGSKLASVLTEDEYRGLLEHINKNYAGTYWVSGAPVNGQWIWTSQGTKMKKEWFGRTPLIDASKCAYFCSNTLKYWDGICADQKRFICEKNKQSMPPAPWQSPVMTPCSVTTPCPATTPCPVATPCPVTMPPPITTPCPVTMPPPITTPCPVITPCPVTALSPVTMPPPVATPCSVITPCPVTALSPVTTSSSTTANQSAVNCPTNYRAILNKCYSFSVGDSPWNDAHKTCQNEAARLVSFADANAVTVIVKHMKGNRKKYGYQGHYWTSGATVAGTWIWTGLGSTMNGSYFRKVPQINKNRCALFIFRVGMYQAEKCVTGRKFICEKSP